MDETESELENQEVKVSKGRKVQVSVEAGKEESLKNKKKKDTAVWFLLKLQRNQSPRNQ